MAGGLHSHLCNGWIRSQKGHFTGAFVHPLTPPCSQTARSSSFPLPASVGPVLLTASFVARQGCARGLGEMQAAPPPHCSWTGPAPCGIIKISSHCQRFEAGKSACISPSLYFSNKVSADLLLGSRVDESRNCSTRAGQSLF